jgi:hypothetical protein
VEVDELECSREESVTGLVMRLLACLLAWLVQTQVGLRLDLELQSEYKLRPHIESRMDVIDLFELPWKDKSQVIYTDGLIKCTMLRNFESDGDWRWLYGCH